ncbi:hypothetical protein Bca52824_077706 [Brassica carinata]|uniref:Pentatricopeptide repeat-containing protein n=1 Tax=Brassica carinata TaxID=52824 RepID=A0A8X7PW77_BRACI|nr:hypothetical protein Bca52824_077706 [Brassica carinata]
MLSAYVNASDMEGAEKFFKRIKVDGFEPNVVTYGTMIKGYAKADDLDKVMEVYEKMRLSGISEPNHLNNYHGCFWEVQGFRERS